MPEKTVQLGFRVTPEEKRRLKLMAAELDVPVQRLIEDAVAATYRDGPVLGVQQASVPRVGLEESQFIEEMQWFFRNADREMIRDVRSMVKVMRKAADASGRSANLKIG